MAVTAPPPLLWVSIALLRFPTELKDEKMDLSRFKLTRALCVFNLLEQDKTFYKQDHIEYVCVFHVDKSAICRVNRWLEDSERRGGGYCPVMSCRSCVIAAG